MELSKQFDGASVLVTGGTGFIGNAIAEKLYRLHADVTIQGIKHPFATYASKFNYLQLDLRDRIAVLEGIKGRGFNYVFHCAGYVDHKPFLSGGRGVIDAHFFGTMNLVEAVAGQSLKRFIQIGSSDEYGGALAPQSESVREQPISPYSAAKSAASHFIESLAISDGFPGVVARLFLVFGPGQSVNRFIPHVISQCLQDIPFPVSEGKQLRDFCFIEDVVAGLLRCATTSEIDGETFNIASGNPTSIRSVLEMIVSILGKGQPEFGKFPYRLGENMALYANIEKAAQTLSWAPKISLEEGLNKTVNWFVEQHLAKPPQ